MDIEKKLNNELSEGWRIVNVFTLDANVYVLMILG